MIDRIIVMYLALGLFIPFSMERMGRMLRSRAPHQGAMDDVYESGIEAQGDTWQPQFLRYYSYALIFVLFDAETAVLFPWADAFHRIPPFLGLQAMAFVGMLLLGLVCAWKKGALRWK